MLVYKYPSLYAIDAFWPPSLFLYLGRQWENVDNSSLRSGSQRGLPGF